MPGADPIPTRLVAVLGLGGTIAMTSGEGGRAVPALSAADLVAAVPGLAGGGIAIRPVELARLPGASLGTGRWCSPPAPVPARCWPGLRVHWL